MPPRRHHRPRRRRERGFTLIELMIALVLFSVVTAGMMAVAVTMVNGYRDQDVTIDAESATRATMDYIADAVRGASPGVPANSIVDVDASSCPKGSFAIVNNVVSTNPGVYSNTSDELTILFASGSVVTTLTNPYAGGPGTINVVDGSQFAQDDFVVVTDFDNGHLFHVASVSGNQLTLDSNACATPNYPTGGYLAGAMVIRAQRASFKIDAVDGIPVLAMDADAEGTRFGYEPIAEGIEDLEVAIAIDGDGNGVLSEDNLTAGADEWFGNVAGEAIPAFTTSVRAIRISLVARTTKPFTGINTYKLDALEDRPANGSTDNFRRRTLSTIIEIRNLGGSP